MLPRSGVGQQPGNKQRRGGLPFIKAQDLTTQPQIAKIQAVKSDAKGQFGPQIVLKVAFQGETRFVGVVVNLKDGSANPSYQLLEKAFGYDENDWVGKSITLYTEQNEFTEQFQMRIGLPKKGGRGAEGE